MKMKKRGITVLLVICIGVVALFLLVRMGSSGEKLQKQLELGQTFLEDLEYEQAIACFLEAIEIDPMSVEAYLGAASAYEKSGDIQSAIAMIESGIAMTNENQLVSELERLKQLIEPENTTTSDAETQQIEEEASEGEDPVVQWIDPVFEAKIREAMGIPSGEIYESQLMEIEMIRILGDSHSGINMDTFGPYGYGGAVDGLLASFYDIDNETFTERGNITSLEDIVHFKNLVSLTIIANQITDVSPLKQLTKLESVNLSLNHIEAADAGGSLQGNAEFVMQFQNMEIGDPVPEE